MKRKIIKQGHNTLTVTLPTKWAKRFDLSAGSEIELSEKDNGLFITTEKHSEEIKKITIDITDLDIPTIWKFFMSVYREGYDEMVVKFDPNANYENPYKYFSHNKVEPDKSKIKKNKTALEFIGNIVSRFIGFELVDYGRDSATIRDLTLPTSKEFENSFRRVFLLVDQMAEETLNSFKNKDPKILNHIHDIDVTLDKFHDYCIRTLNKLENKEPRKASIYFSILYILELMGDEFKNISHHYIQDFPEEDLKNIIEVTNSVVEQIKAFYDLFYKFDKEKIKKISDIDSQRYFGLNQTSKKLKTDPEKEIFHHLRIIARYLNALVELRIELEF